MKLGIQVAILMTVLVSTGYASPQYKLIRSTPEVIIEIRQLAKKFAGFSCKYKYVHAINELAPIQTLFIKEEAFLKKNFGYAIPYKLKRDDPNFWYVTGDNVTGSFSYYKATDKGAEVFQCDNYH